MTDGTAIDSLIARRRELVNQADHTVRLGPQPQSFAVELVRTAIAGGELARAELEQLAARVPRAFRNGFHLAIAEARFDRAVIAELGKAGHGGLRPPDSDPRSSPSTHNTSEYPMDHDLNTKLANYCVTCQARADSRRPRGRGPRTAKTVGTDPTGRPTPRPAATTPGRQVGPAGDACQGGKMLVHDDDLHHQHEHQALIDDAASQYRTVHVPALDLHIDPTGPGPAAGGPRDRPR